MIIIVYTPCNRGTISEQLGDAEYSYYFVLREFLPILEQLGDVIHVESPEQEVDSIYLRSKAEGKYCVFLSFTPPHKTYINTLCPCIPVLAWEFDDIPSESWDDEPRNDWRLVLGKLGLAITHSRHSALAVKKALRDNFPVIAIPSPVWDRFRPRNEVDFHAPATSFSLTVDGVVIDTKADNFDLELDKNINSYMSSDKTIQIDGLTYTSILNPLDGRKNWQDIISAFCWALQAASDATLILKFTSRHNREWPAMLRKVLEDMPPFECRVIVIKGYLDDDSYKALSESSTYAVNASKGEGQCLPLMEYMSAGKPAISPNHTGMGDYITPNNSFVVATALEPVAWPDDTRRMYRTTQHRVDWESLRDCFEKSYIVAKETPQEYGRLAKNAAEDLRRHCSRETVTQKLKKLFEFHQNSIETSSQLLQ